MLFRSLATAIRRIEADYQRSADTHLIALPLPAFAAAEIDLYFKDEPTHPTGSSSTGTAFAPLSKAFEAAMPAGRAQGAIFFVACVWRDYVRQFGSIAIDARDFERLTGERGVSDIALWLTPGTPDGEVQRAARELAQQLGIGELVEFASASPSPTGCRPSPLASACSASPRVSARRCWRGARSSACWPTLA